MLPPRPKYPAVALAGFAVLVMSACVPPANKSSSDTIAPLALPPVTSSSLVAAVTLITAATGTALPPPGDAAAPATSPPTTLAPQPTTTVAGTTTTISVAAAGAHTYTVAAKDTLYGIARRCSIGPQALADYNGWTDGTAHPLYPGTVVKTPCDAASTTATTVATTATSAPVATTTTAPASTTTIAASPDLYTIVAGDYLAGIAAKNGTTVQAIVSVNGWPDGAKHLIVPGQQIKLPAK